jgi:hypothetical protein
LAGFSLIDKPGDTRSLSKTRRGVDEYGFRTFYMIKKEESPGMSVLPPMKKEKSLSMEIPHPLPPPEEQTSLKRIERERDG